MLWQLQRGAHDDTPPPLLPGVADLYLAFLDLTTERRFPGGPIPWSAINAYPTNDPALLQACIRAADRAVLAWKPEEQPEPLRPGLLRGKT